MAKMTNPKFILVHPCKNLLPHHQLKIPNLVATPTATITHTTRNLIRKISQDLEGQMPNPKSHLKRHFLKLRSPRNSTFWMSCQAWRTWTTNLKRIISVPKVWYCIRTASESFGWLKRGHVNLFLWGMCRVVSGLRKLWWWDHYLPQSQGLFLKKKKPTLLLIVKDTLRSCQLLGHDSLGSLSTK